MVYIVDMEYFQHQKIKFLSMGIELTIFGLKFEYLAY